MNKSVLIICSLFFIGGCAEKEKVQESTEGMDSIASQERTSTKESSNTSQLSNNSSCSKTSESASTISESISGKVDNGYAIAAVYSDADTEPY